MNLDRRDLFRLGALLSAWGLASKKTPDRDKMQRLMAEAERRGCTTFRLAREPWVSVVVRDDRRRRVTMNWKFTDLEVEGQPYEASLLELDRFMAGSMTPKDPQPDFES
jgi:hypothetical protein